MSVISATDETSEPPPPLCFVLMPFGRKTDAAGRVTNFDSVFHKIIVPAVERAGLEPIRADEEKIGGTIHKPMFERLMLCHYAVADITGANPNVFYELGIRHALRPASTVILFVDGTVIPFDVALVRGISYRTDGAGEPIDAEIPIAAIAAHLSAARNTPHDDSPIFQLIDVLPHWQIDHTKTDVFREQIDYSKKYKERLAAAVRAGPEAVKQIAAEPALRNSQRHRERHHRRSLSVVARRRGLYGHDRSLRPHAAPVAERQDDARAAWLCAQPRGALR